MSVPTVPFRETVAKLVGDGITRHVNGVTSMRHNKTAIATVARQVSEDIEAVVLAETERLDLDLTAVRAEVQRLTALMAEQTGALTWGTTCTGCAQQLDAAYALTMRAETAEEEAAGLRQAVALMRPVVEYVSMGRSYVDAMPYPDGAARRALGALDDAGLAYRATVGTIGRCGICGEGVVFGDGGWMHFCTPARPHDIDGVTVDEPTQDGA